MPICVWKFIWQCGRGMAAAYVVGGRWLLTFWLASVFLFQQFFFFLTGCSAFVQGGAPLSTVLCTGRSATQHGPLYREERHSARSFVQGGAPLSTVLCTGRSATQHGPLYREERHSARSFVQGGAPLSTVLCTGRSATQHGSL